MPASLTKEEQVKLIEESLDEGHNIIVGHYAGLSVDDMAGLRTQLRDKGLGFKVVKNNLFKLAWKNKGLEVSDELTALFKGPIGVTFGGEDLPAAANVLRDYAKDKDAFEIKGGVFEGKVIDEKGVADIAGLPTKPELYSKAMASMNAPATNIAVVMKEVITSLARGIKAVGEKNG